MPPFQGVSSFIPEIILFLFLPNISSMPNFLGLFVYFISLQNRPFVHNLVFSVVVEHLNISFVLTSASASEIVLKIFSLSPNKLASTT